MNEGLMHIKVVDEEGTVVWSCDMGRTDEEAEAKDADYSGEAMQRALRKIRAVLVEDEDVWNLLHLVSGMMRVMGGKE